MHISKATLDITHPSIREQDQKVLVVCPDDYGKVEGHPLGPLRAECGTDVDMVSRDCYKMSSGTEAEEAPE